MRGVESLDHKWSHTITDNHVLSKGPRKQLVSHNPMRRKEEARGRGNILGAFLIVERPLQKLKKL